MLFRSPSYEEFIKEFAYAANKLHEIAPTVDSVNDLETENQEFAFITAFRQIIRLINKLSSFTEFTFDDLEIDEQTFNDHKSKYLDLYDKVRSNQSKEKVSILEDVNFELELIRKDEINVAYILQLLAKLKGESDDNKGKLKDAIEAYISNEVTLRSKRELIEKFLEDNFLQVGDEDNVEEAFYAFAEQERMKNLTELCESEELDQDKVDLLIKDYLDRKSVV